MMKFIKKRYAKYISLFIILVILLLILAIKPALTLAFGEEVYLKTKVYDPRDIFRGDYIHLTYDISEININKLDKEIQQILEEDEYELSDEEIYVVLTLEDKYHQVKSVTLTPPSNEIYLKGKWAYLNKMRGPVVMVTYPWDKFYVSENTGKALEEKIRQNESFARIKVLKGYGILMDVEVIE